MARAYEYDDGTFPLTGAAGERFADPTSADNVMRAERDSTAYSVPAGDPFGDALAERFAEPARLEPVRVPKAPAAPPPPSQQAAPPPPRRKTPPRREEPRRQQRPPSRPAPPPARQQPPQRQPQRQQPQPQRPTLKQSKQPVNRLTTDLTKRPSLRKQQPPSRARPRQARDNSMARFPTNTGRAAPHPAESPAPPRRAKNVRPIWPIIIFIVILIAMVRGCVDSTHHDGSLPPTNSVIAPAVAR